MAEPGVAPILEFDPDREAIIEPSSWFQPVDGMPRRAVMTWMRDAHDTLLTEYAAVELLRFELESTDSPVWRINVDDTPIAIVLAPVGAAASAVLLEALIGFGCDTVITVGSSGGLVPHLPPGTVVVPEDIIRDEGTSYHYAPAQRVVRVDPAMQDHLRTSLTAADLTQTAGSLWTTDAFFRETAARVERRVAEGAVAVDMEASALATVADFRGIRSGHAVYMADTLHGDAWDPRQLISRDTPFRTRLLQAAVVACATA